MRKVTMQDIEQFWNDKDYMKLKKPNIDDFCHMWANEVGILLPESFSVSEHNSHFFTKINSEKHAVNLILEKLNYPIVKTESLTYDVDCAVKRATQLFRKNGNGVIRANKMAGGAGTFIIQKEKSIRNMISTLINNPKGPILPLYSPFYASNVEYGVFLINGKMELCIAKHLNKDTGLHNLSLGAKAEVITDPNIIDKLNSICAGLSQVFGISFGRIDILDTQEGLKIIELSAPNFKKFSLQDKECMAIAKNLFLKYYENYYM